MDYCTQKNHVSFFFQMEVRLSRALNAHAQSVFLAFSKGYCVFVWTGRNDSKTLHVDANFFENEKEVFKRKTNTCTCGHGLKA